MRPGPQAELGRASAMLSGRLGFVMAEAELARLFGAMDAGALTSHSRRARPLSSHDHGHDAARQRHASSTGDS